ncbi:MAG TPA: hypothetical protein VG944_10760, partial [Fimbriimonas sp.]|nr:hypothetical protein [Fimbriimonas sp.]
GILNLHVLGDSIPRPSNQFLMKFTSNPFRMTKIRELSGGQSLGEIGEVRRIYPWKGSLYLIEDDGIDLIDASGKPMSRLCGWEGSIVGLCNGRWVIGQQSSYQSDVKIVAVDLSNGQATTVSQYRPDDAVPAYGWSTSGPTVSEDSPYLLFQERKNVDLAHGEQLSRSFTIHMPDGKKTYMQGAGGFPMGEYVATSIDNGRQFALYSAATGQLIKTYQTGADFTSKSAPNVP